MIATANYRLISWHEEDLSRAVHVTRSRYRRMRLGFLRRKNTDLPLFNGRRNGTRSSSPHRNAPSRRHIFIGLLIVAIVILLYNSTSSSEPKVRDFLLPLILCRERSQRHDSTCTTMPEKTYLTTVFSSSNPSLPYVPISTRIVHSGPKAQAVMPH